jgi:hypothetical protein
MSFCGNPFEHPGFIAMFSLTVMFKKATSSVVFSIRDLGRAHRQTRMPKDLSSTPMKIRAWPFFSVLAVWGDSSKLYPFSEARKARFYKPFAFNTGVLKYRIFQPRFENSTRLRQL